MPRKADDSRPQVAWVNLDLNKSQTAEMKKQLPDAAEVLGWVHRLLDDGYSVTMKAEPAYDCHAAYCFPARTEPLNAGMALAARGSSPFSALRGLVYRHYTVFDGNWRVPASALHVDED